MNRIWYDNNGLFYSLIPFSYLYECAIKCRRFLFRSGFKKTHRLSVPVIVVGNITVGGTGKTPFIIWLANWLKEQGYRPGIVSRGYGGKPTKYPQLVNAHSDPKQVGDEPILLFEKTNCPVMVHPKRVLAAKILLNEFNCDILLSDDGLQHYALARDIEIVMVDGMRRFGNQWCLPAGPLREKISRIQSSDYVIVNGRANHSNEYSMQFQAAHVASVKNPTEKKAIDDFKSMTVHAIAGIGNPQRYFSFLKELGLTIIEHPFPDHYRYRFKDIDFDKDSVVLMTEKDAVKCRQFADERHWCLPVSACLDESFISSLKTKLGIE